MELLVTSHPSRQRRSSMVWLSTTTCTPRRPRRRLRPPLLRSMRFSLQWLPSMANPGGGRKKNSPRGKIFFNHDPCPPPAPYTKKFYPRETFSTLTPHCPHWAHRPPPKPPPRCPPHPLAPQSPCSATSTEFLWRLPRLPWPRVANHMPPILGPTHGAPRSKHNSTNCRMDWSDVYVQEHIDLLTPSVPQREETTAPAQCAKA